MAKKRLTIKEKLKKLQQASFVGRENELTSFQSNFNRDSEDLHFANIINVFGQGGVGKTTLLKKFEEFASKNGAIVAYTDETITNVLEYMAEVASQFEKQGKPLSKFSERYKVYRQKKKELESDPEAPTGLAGFLGRTMVKGGIELAKEYTGIKPVLDLIDTRKLEDIGDQWSSYVAKKLTNKDDVHLVQEPIEVLTPIWLNKIVEIAEKERICLLIDTYEETYKFLDIWLRDLIVEKYGEIDTNIIFVVAGRKPFDPNKWSGIIDIAIPMPIEPFTEQEASLFLDRRGISSMELREIILRLSGRIPVLLATLAEASPNSIDDISDVSNYAVERFLKWVNNSQQRDVALFGAIPLQINYDFIKHLTSFENSIALFEWLVSMPFIQKKPSKSVYHDVVRMQMLQYIRIRSVEQWEYLQNEMVQYFEDKKAKLNISNKDGFQNDEWLNYSLFILYHQFCKNPNNYLPVALNGFIEALEEKRSYALKWAGRIASAEIDSGVDSAKRWGEKLELSLREYELDDYSTLELTLNHLLNLPYIDSKNKPVIIAWKAQINNLQEKYELALANFQKAIELKPDYEWAFALRGSVYKNLEQYDKALEDLNRAIELKPDDEWNFAQRGSVYKNLEQYDKALEDLNRAIELKPDDEWNFAQRGSVYKNLKQYDKALEDLNRAIELKPDDEWNFAQRGSVYQNLKQYDKALEDLNKAIELKPDYEWAFALRGSVYKNLKQYDKALEDLNKAIELKPDYEWAFALRGYVYNDLKQYDKALEDLNRAIELKPDDEWNFTQRGSVYQNLKQYDKALEDLNKAIELKPDYEWAFALRGSVYQNLKQYDKALEDLNRAIELKNDYEGAIALRGSVYNDLKQYDKALEDLNRAIELKPDDEWNFTQRGSVYQNLKQYDKALEDLNKAIELKPDDEWAFAQRGSVYNDLKQYDKALEDLNKAIELKPDYEWAFALRGSVYQNLKQYDKALEDLNKAIELKNDYEGAIALRGSVYQNLKQYDKALEDLNKAIELKNDYEGAIALRGSVYNDLKQYDKALEDLNRAIELKPDDEWNFTQRGSVYQNLKQYDKALEDLNKAIELKPDYEWAFALRGSVYQNLKQYDKALEDLNKAIELKNDYEGAIALRGSVYQNLKQYDKALEDLNRAIELKPDDEWAFALRGSVYQNLKQYDKALEDLNKAIELKPDDEWNFAQRGKLFLQLSEIQNSISDFEKSLHFDDHDDWSYYLYHLALVKNSDKSQAEIKIKKAIKIAFDLCITASSNLQNWLNLSLYFISFEKKEKAVEILTKEELNHKRSLPYWNDFQKDLEFHIYVCPEASLAHEFLDYAKRKIKKLQEV